MTSQSEVDDIFDEVLLNVDPKLNKDHLTTDALKKSQLLRGDCFKPRCVFSDASLSNTEKGC